MTTATENKIHRFESAGLGAAPFTVVGIESTADRAAMNREREANGQVFTTNHCGGTCDYCGQAIWNVFKIRSADGREFKVGCDCVRKTGDAGLIRVVDEGVKAIERKARQQKGAAAAEAGKAYFASKREELKAFPHPAKWRAEQGETAVDWLGGSVIVTFHSRDMADRGARMMTAGGFVRKATVDSLDETADSLPTDR